MKRFVAISAMTAFLVFAGCKSSAEKMGDKFWESSKTSTAGDKIMDEKRAYVYYKDAIDAEGANASIELQNNFLASALARIDFSFQTEGSTAQTILFIREEIDKLMEGEVVTPELRDQYATFIMKLAEEARNSGDLSLCMSHLEQAVRFAADKDAPQTMKNDIVTEFVADQISYAKELYETGKDNVEDMIRAEYYCHVALNYDSTNTEALELLSDSRKKLLNVYTFFPRVIKDKPDSALYRHIDSTDILISVVANRSSRSETTLKIKISNDSYNAIRLKQDHFFLLNENGDKFNATAITVDQELLNQGSNTEVTLKFRKPSGKIKAVVFESNPRENEHHYAPKYFF